MGNWIHGFKNWIGFNLQMNTDESTGSAGRVEFELSWVLLKAVMMNLTWLLTQSESIISMKESKNQLNVTITIHFLSQWRAYGNSQLDIMKEAVAGLFFICITFRNVRDFGSKPSKVTLLINKIKLGKVETS